MDTLLIEGFFDLLFCLDPIFIVGVPKTGASLTPELELPRINLASFRRVRKNSNLIEGKHKKFFLVLMFLIHPL